MKNGLNALYLTLMILAIPLQTLASPADLEVREYKIPGNGALALELPSTWTDGFGQPPKGLPPTLAIALQDKSIYLKITVFSNAKSAPSYNSPDELMSSTLYAGNNLLPGAVESKISIDEISGSSSHGYYFTVTDAAPKPGDYKYLRQGFIAVNNLQLGFTLLSHQRDSADISTALSTLGSAAQK